jgi:zinc protease
VIEEHTSSPVVVLQLWVKVGARDETASEGGLAHYLEHLRFKGTATRRIGFIDRELEAVGGRMNAGTSHDYTYYHMVLPADRAVGGIETLADISINATFATETLKREQQVILEEMRFGEDNPARHLIRQLYAAAFSDHAPLIGHVDAIRGLTRHLVDFYRRLYVSEAFTLVVVGAVRQAQVLEAAARAFGPLWRGMWDRLAIRSPSVPPVSVRLNRPISQAYLALGCSGPASTAPTQSRSISSCRFSVKVVVRGCSRRLGRASRL